MTAREAKRIALDLVVARIRGDQNDIVAGWVRGQKGSPAELAPDVARLDQALEAIADELERRGKS